MSNGIIIFLLVCFFIVALSGKSGKKSRNLTTKSELDAALGAVRVPSQSDPAVHYTLYPDLIRCSCPDWEKKRSDKEFLGRPERVCKHLAQYYAEHPDDVPEKLKPWQIFIESRAEKGWGLPTTNVVYIDDESLDGVVIDCYPYLSRGWVNVYIQSARFGYNPKEQRWAGNDEPIKSEEWLDVIAQMLHHLDISPITKTEMKTSSEEAPYMHVLPPCDIERFSSEDENLYEEARAFLEEQGRISITLVQRRFKIGFNKACRFVERIKWENQEEKYRKILVVEDSNTTIQSIMSTYKISFEEAKYFFKRMEYEGNMFFSDGEREEIKNNEKNDDIRMVIGEYKKMEDFYEQAANFSLKIGCISGPDLQKHFGFPASQSYCVVCNLFYDDRCKYLPFSFRLSAEELKKRLSNEQAILT